MTKFDPVVPTLFIGMGGIGKEIVLRIRIHILAHEWGSAENPIRIEKLTQFLPAQFLYYGMGNCCDLDSHIDPSDSTIFADDEKLTFPLDLDKYFTSNGDLDRDASIASWFPITREKIRKLGISLNHAPGGIRAISRLYFADKIHLIKTRIVDKIHALIVGAFNSDYKKRVGIEIKEGSLRIVVIATSAGGTGSGAFIDMGYLAKHLAEQITKACKLDLYLMLPSGFINLGYARSDSNTYAAFMELETCMAHAGPNWSILNELTVQSRPYDDIFLFDTANLAGKSAKLANVYDMVADILFHDFASPELAGRRRSIRACHTHYKCDSFCLPVDQDKYGKMKIQYCKAYSAFGQAIIDAKEIQCDDANRENNSNIISALQALTSSDRKSLFKTFLDSAMPWVEANLDGDYKITPGQFMCIIGVNDPISFENIFDKELKSIIHENTYYSCPHIIYTEGIPGKLTCYIELSGFPLMALNNLQKWYANYKHYNPSLPLHIHKDKSLFIHPLAPSSEKIDQLANQFKIFIQGIILGVLKLHADDDERLYCLSTLGEELSIGNERTMRLEGIAPEHLVYLQKKVSASLDRIKTPAQYAGLAALYDFYMTCVYPPAKIKTEDKHEELVKGFANTMCATLADEARKALKKKSTSANVNNEELIALLKGTDDPYSWSDFDVLNVWTEEIDGSESDVYKNEVGSAHMAKRVLRKEFYQAGWLENQFKLAGTGSIVSNEPPLLGEWWVALNGQKNGPHDEAGLDSLIAKGLVNITTKVWKKGMSGWLPAEQVKELNHLFTQPPPLDEEPSPL